MADRLARHLRNTQTEAETRLWSLLRRFKDRGFHFRRQVRLGPYVADFATFGARLIVELDGSQHDAPSARRHDEERTRYLASEGFAVLRFWNDQVFIDAEEVARMIDEALRRRAPFQHATGADRDAVAAPLAPRPPRSRENRKLPTRRKTPTPNPSPQGGGE